jgi:MoaA/NifB/PqqE/SkfB family radical SAM enzyme
LDFKSKLKVYKDVALRPVSATGMLVKHRRTLGYLIRKRKFKQLYNFVFVTYFVRGEDCGKGVLDPVWKFFPQLTPYLWDIEAELTTSCYLRCIHCEHTHWKDNSYRNQNVKFEQFKGVIDSLPNLKWANVTGEGSPFLNPDFRKVVKYLKEKNIYVDFSHDFFYMTDEIARELIGLGVERIYHSIDGASKETYEKVRVGSNFERVVTNIKRFIELKKEMNSPLPEICFRMAVFKENAHEVEKLIDLIHTFGDSKDIGDDPSVNIVGLLEFDDTKSMVSEIPRETIDRVNAKAKKYGLTVYWSHVSHIAEKKAPLEYCVNWTEPYVMIRGHVVPCCAVMMSDNREFLEKNAFGNTYQKPLKEIWNSARYRRFRKMVVDPKGKVPLLCVGCRAYDTVARAKKYGVDKEV